MLDELVIGEASGLRKAVHALVNFKENTFVDDQSGEVVGANDAVG